MSSALSNQPRPDGLRIIRDSIASTLRASVLSTVAVCLLFPYFHVLAAAWPYGDRWFYIAVSVVVHETLYFGINTFFLVGGDILKAFSIPRTEAMIAEPALLRKTLQEGIFNHLIFQPLSLYFLYPFLVSEAGLPPPSSPLPPFYIILLHFIAADKCNELLFYWSHRLLHHDAIYQHIHKQHHNYKGTIGFAAEYAHPVEGLLSNQLPTMIYCMGMGVHPLIWFVWLAWRLAETYESHSGYDFSASWLAKVGIVHGHSLLHDFHHTVNRGGYGSELTDWLFGTDATWLKLGGRDGHHAATGTGRVAGEGEAQATPSDTKKKE